MERKETVDKNIYAKTETKRRRLPRKTNKTETNQVNQTESKTENLLKNRENKERVSTR